jgi:soluble cytochrome b562
MACQTVNINPEQARANLTMRRMQETTRQIRRIEIAKELVCGVISKDSQRDLRKRFDDLIHLIDEGIKWLRSGALDELSDDQLKRVLGQLQSCDKKLAFVLDGSVAIGLEAIEPFPRLLSQLRDQHQTMQSQIEGIMLSLNTTFQGLVARSAKEIDVPS